MLKQCTEHKNQTVEVTFLALINSFCLWCVCDKLNFGNCGNFQFKFYVDILEDFPSSTFQSFRDRYATWSVFSHKLICITLPPANKSPFWMGWPNWRRRQAVAAATKKREKRSNYQICVIWTNRFNFFVALLCFRPLCLIVKDWESASFSVYTHNFCRCCLLLLLFLSAVPVAISY